MCDAGSDNLGQVTTHTGDDLIPPFLKDRPRCGCDMFRNVEEVVQNALHELQNLEPTSVSGIAIIKGMGYLCSSHLIWTTQFLDVVINNRALQYQPVANAIQGVKL